MRCLSQEVCRDKVQPGPGVSAEKRQREGKYQSETYESLDLCSEFKVARCLEDLNEQLWTPVSVKGGGLVSNM